jgi:hypothetical protein
MALRGSLQEFGIADAFSLIGSQSKSGRLQVLSGDEQATLHFFEGNVVRTDATRRSKNELLGNMLVRAQVLQAAHIEQALQLQKVSRRRLGDTLVEMGVLTPQDLQVFTRLQSAETVYRVLMWRTGSYAFTPATAAVEGTHPPLRAEVLLMEGFRQMDLWPALRLAVPSYALTFVVKQDLPALLAAAPQAEADDFALDFGEAPAAPAAIAPAAPATVSLKNLGPNELLVFNLVRPQLDVQRLIDLSRLGEFATCQAVANLLAADILVAVQPVVQASSSAAAKVGGKKASSEGVLSFGIRGPLKVLGVCALWALICSSGLPPLRLHFLETALSAAPDAPGTPPPSNALQAQLALGTQRHLQQALSAYHSHTGHYPERLEVLVQEKLLTADQLQYPFQEPYLYTVQPQGYVLTRPLR